MPIKLSPLWHLTGPRNQGAWSLLILSPSVHFSLSHKEINRHLKVKLSHPTHSVLKDPFIESWKTNKPLVTNINERRTSVCISVLTKLSWSSILFYLLWFPWSKEISPEKSVGKKFFKIHIFLFTDISKCQRLSPPSSPPLNTQGTGGLNGVKCGLSGLHPLYSSQ